VSPLLPTYRVSSPQPTGLGTLAWSFPDFCHGMPLRRQSLLHRVISRSWQGLVTSEETRTIAPAGRVSAFYRENPFNLSYEVVCLLFCVPLRADWTRACTRSCDPYCFSRVGAGSENVLIPRLKHVLWCPIWIVKGLSLGTRNTWSPFLFSK
jgi:hypothetical protein